MPESDFLTGSAAGAGALAPAGNLPPLFIHSSMVLNGVNFLVLPYELLEASWHIPLSDFLTAGSAANAEKAMVAASAKRFFFNICISFKCLQNHLLTLNHIQVFALHNAIKDNPTYEFVHNLRNENGDQL